MGKWFCNKKKEVLVEPELIVPKEKCITTTEDVVSKCIYDNHYLKLIELINPVINYLYPFFLSSGEGYHKYYLIMSYNEIIDITFNFIAAYHSGQSRITILEKTTNNQIDFYLNHERVGYNYPKIQPINSKYSYGNPYFLRINGETQFSAEFKKKYIDNFKILTENEKSIVIVSEKVDIETYSKTMGSIIKMLSDSELIINKIKEQYPQIEEYYEEIDRQKTVNNVLRDVKKEKANEDFNKTIDIIFKNI
jgi:hypothetical protein